jgi:hypothetical protein
MFNARVGDRWAPGTTIVHTETWRDRLWAARPLHVLEDSDDGLFCWLPHGTVRLVPAGHRVPDRKDRIVADLAAGTWDYEPHVWDVSTVSVVRPGQGFAVWASWLPSGEHLGYYVNLQRPMVRTGLGYEAMDLMLDVVATPDLTWQWKDEDELADLLERGVYDAGLGSWIRDQAETAITALERRAFPFDGSLLERRPGRTEEPALPASLVGLISQVR